ncbi:MAG: hypothetical protein HZA93_29980 [Verrucomicrobia bacterium]|nr:hypothetical protein [Verrucomicrobiota bacterium]
MSKATPNAGCGFLFAAVFALAGVVLLASAWAKRRTERDPVALYAMAGTGVVFAAVGGGLLAGLRTARLREREAAALRAQFPAEPWHWRRDWHDRRILPAPENGPAMMWFFAIVWNGLSVPAALAVWPKLSREPVLWIVFLFSVIGAFLLWNAIYRTLQAHKFGRPVFEPESLPGAIGGYLAGVIRVPARIALERDAHLHLACVSRVSSGSGRDRSVRETLRWETGARLAREKWSTGPGGTLIPVLLYIAPGCAPSDVDADPDNRVLWRLSVEAAVPGVDFTAKFEVPVFATGRTEPRPAATTALLDEYRAAALDAEALAAAGVRHERAGGCERFEFSGSHVRGARFVSSVIAFALLVLATRLWFSQAPWIVAAVVGFFDLIAWAIAADLWAGTTELRLAGEDLVVVKHGWRGVTESRFKRGDAADVVVKEAMSLGERKFYRLALIGAPGVDLHTPAPAEPFRARKLRYLLRRRRRPENLTDEDIRRELARTPKFEFTIAHHLPGLATAEAVASLVLERICDDDAAHR